MRTSVPLLQGEWLCWDGGKREGENEQMGVRMRTSVSLLQGGWLCCDGGKREGKNMRNGVRMRNRASLLQGEEQKMRWVIDPNQIVALTLRRKQ